MKYDELSDKVNSFKGNLFVIKTYPAKDILGKRYGQVGGFIRGLLGAIIREVADKIDPSEEINVDYKSDDREYDSLRGCASKSSSEWDPTGEVNHE